MQTAVNVATTAFNAGITSPLTVMQIKQRLYSQGSSLKRWAKENGYSYETVSATINGKIKIKRPYGKGFEVGQKLCLIFLAENGDIIRAKA